MTQPLNPLADDKLSILYFINCLGIPLTNSQITRFFVENNLINYFDLQQSIIELIAGGLINNIETGTYDFLTLTPKGKDALAFFKKRICPSQRNIMELYAQENRGYLKKESQITADYKKINNKEYEVTCKVTEKDLTLMELKINLPNSNQAKIICENWRLRAPEIFKAIMERLT